ncbi:hypothetical protein [Mesorhizobium sp.]|uniref:hypothetical protein n=1 Tax=Mesorhizobium sp. TaxID=1871066 RepID=UPI00121F1099|nr:hypothetical protein [Mesorhizobium sp.]TIN76795.1 MAG: hypothetical protein E5Y09_21125 [Mesorhizobium sp.]
MTEYRCTWWEYTGRYADIADGIRSPILRNSTTGEELASRDLPIAAIFAAKSGPCGPDGKSVVCVVPRSSGKWHWYIDSRCSNCTKPDDKEHRCWVRHGTVGETIHVDKNGNTCAAGAGSIAVPGFHGFLHHGVLRDC